MDRKQEMQFLRPFGVCKESCESILLIVTFLCSCAAFLASNVMAILVIIIWALPLEVNDGGVAVLVVITILYLAGFVYHTVVWMVNVVSVLENSCGFQAMLKSKKLIKGKIGLAILIFCMLKVSFFLIKFLFSVLVVQGSMLGSLDTTAYSIICLLLLSNAFLLQLVIQTLYNFVCKSDHHENIDKSALSDHLEVFIGQYEPLKSNDVQLKRCPI